MASTRCCPHAGAKKANGQAVGGVVVGCLIVAFAARFLLFNEMGLASLLYGF